MVSLTFFNLNVNIVCFCLSIASRSPPTTPSGCGAKTQNLRTVLPWVVAWLFTCLAVWAWSSHVTSVFSYGKWAMMIIPPSRLHMCLQRASGPERAFWVPESGTNMNYSATWGEGNIFRGYGCHSQGWILIQAKLHLFLNPDPELWLSRCFCFLGSHKS